MQNRSQSLLVALALAVIVGITVLAYAPGLSGVFVFDSVERVVRNDSLKIDSAGPEQLLGAAYAGQAGYPKRGLAYVSLALNYHGAGGRFDPFAFKLTNLVIHVLNGLLVFALASLVIKRWWKLQHADDSRDPSLRVLVLACVATGMWMLQPIQLTSVLYVVQRMTSLSATLVFIGAIAYLIARERLEDGRGHAFTLMYGGVIVCTGVGFFFKQNALLLPAFIAVIELLLFDRRRLAMSYRRMLRLYFGLVLALPIVALIAAIVSGVDLGASSYAFRDYDMFQRVLTQARVLFFYLSLLAVPDIRRFGLFHDDFAASTGPIDPWTTLVAVLAWTVVVIVVARGARRRAPWAFAIAWFLVGHAAESSILPLELVHEHRNYAPSVGIFVALAYYAGIAWDRAGSRRALVPTVLAVWMVTLALVTYVRANSWRDPAVLMETLARHHPGSYRAVNGYAFNSVPRNADLSIRFDAFRRAAALDGRVVSPLVEMSKIAAALGIYMVAQGGASPSPVAEGGGMPIADMQLLADSGHNARLMSALDDEITRRLGHERPRTDNVVALVALVDCSAGVSRECASLRGSATRWHASALSNGRLPAHLRAVLELSMAKLYAIAGDNDGAVRHARLAGLSAGENLAYRLQEATLYALLERWRELGETLEEIEARFSVRVKTDPMYSDLRAQYERSRGQ